MDSLGFLNLMKKKGVVYTEQQKEIVLQDDDKTLVVAVPGSGKTTTLIGKIGYLILVKGLKASEILPITFSKSSAEDMTERFKKFFKEEIKEKVEFQTIHAYANRVLLAWTRKFNREERLISQKEIISIIKNSYKKIFKEMIAEEDIEKYQTLISYCKNRELSLEEIKKLEEDNENIKVKHLDKMYLLYEETKNSAGLYDFDDMLVKCLNILETYPNTLNYMRNKYKYILMDESQDTSILQHKIVKLILNPIEGKVLIVGDEDQSIYGFRGAYPEIMLNCEMFYGETKRYYMDKNFRSKNKIVTVSNKIIELNKNRYKKVVKTDNLDGENIKISICKNEKMGLDVIKKELENLNKNGTETVGVLYRNNITSIPVINSIKDKGLDFSINSYKKGFFNHWIVRDILNLLAFANSPTDIETFSKIYYKANTYLNKFIINYLIKYKKENKECKTVIDILRGYSGIKDFQLKNLENLEYNIEVLMRGKEKYHLRVDKFLKDCGYCQYLEKIAEKKEVSVEGYLSMVATLLDISKEANNFEEFQDNLIELENLIEEKAKCKNKKITFSSLHSSKGLEFDKVFLLDCTNSKFPILEESKLLKDENEEMLEEERRLFYVGCTRAKNELKILTYGEPNLFVKGLIKNKQIKDIIDIKEYDNKLEEKHLKEGLKVTHSKYGEGIVKEVGKYKMKVLFEDVERELYTQITLLTEALCLTEYF